MRETCADDWDLPNIRQACTNTNCANNNCADPFGSLPVTHRESGVTYRNYYCAVCNRAGFGVQFWKPRLECPTLHGYNERYYYVKAGLLGARGVYYAKRSNFGTAA